MPKPKTVTARELHRRMLDRIAAKGATMARSTDGDWYPSPEERMEQSMPSMPKHTPGPETEETAGHLDGLYADAEELERMREVFPALLAEGENAAVVLADCIDAIEAHYATNLCSGALRDVGRERRLHALSTLRAAIARARGEQS